MERSHVCTCCRQPLAPSGARPAAQSALQRRHHRSYGERREIATKHNFKADVPIVASNRKLIVLVVLAQNLCELGGANPGRQHAGGIRCAFAAHECRTAGDELQAVLQAQDTSSDECGIFAQAIL